MAAIASSMFSPAIKRLVTRLNPGSFEKKSFSSVFCERYKRAALDIMPCSTFANYHPFRGDWGVAPERTLSHGFQSSSTDGDRRSNPGNPARGIEGQTDRESYCRSKINDAIMGALAFNYQKLTKRDMDAIAAPLPSLQRKIDERLDKAQV